MGTSMSWAAPLALITSTLLVLLSLDSPIWLAGIGYFWAALHLAGAIAAWNKK